MFMFICQYNIFHRSYDSNYENQFQKLYYGGDI